MVFYVASDVPDAVARLQEAFAPGVVLGYGGNLCRTRAERRVAAGAAAVGQNGSGGENSSGSDNDGSDSSDKSDSSEDGDMTRSAACLQRALAEQVMLTDARVVSVSRALVRPQSRDSSTPI